MRRPTKRSPGGGRSVCLVGSHFEHDGSLGCLEKTCSSFPTPLSSCHCNLWEISELQIQYLATGWARMLCSPSDWLQADRCSSTFGWLPSSREVRKFAKKKYDKWHDKLQQRKKPKQNEVTRIHASLVTNRRQRSQYASRRTRNRWGAWILGSTLDRNGWKLCLYRRHFCAPRNG